VLTVHGQNIALEKMVIWLLHTEIHQEKRRYMRTQGHVAGGILATGIVLAIIRPPSQIADRLVLLGAIGGSLPDWDTLIYFARNRSFNFGNDLRHHTWITHTLPFYLIPAAIFYYLGLYLSNTELQWMTIVFGVSTTMHLIQDMYGSGDGIMLFYPFSRKMVGVALTGNHGMEWMEQYLQSRAYQVEKITIVLALVFLVLYVYMRIFLQGHSV
jgi:hypothetical protein